MYKSLKKSLILVYSLISTFLISIPVAFAQGEEIASVFREVAQLLVGILMGVAVFLEELLPMFSGPYGGGLGRLIIGVLITIFLYMGVGNVEFIRNQPKGQTYVRVISIILALITSIGIPENIVRGIFGGWHFWLYVVSAILLMVARGESRIANALRGVSFLTIGLGCGLVGKEVEGDIPKTFFYLLTAILTISSLYYLFYRMWTSAVAEVRGEPQRDERDRNQNPNPDNRNDNRDRRNEPQQTIREQIEPMVTRIEQSHNIILAALRRNRAPPVGGRGGVRRITATTFRDISANLTIIRNESNNILRTIGRIRRPAQIVQIRQIAENLRNLANACRGYMTTNNDLTAATYDAANTETQINDLMNYINTLP